MQIYTYLCTSIYICTYIYVHLCIFTFTSQTHTCSVFLFSVYIRFHQQRCVASATPAVFPGKCRTAIQRGSSQSRLAPTPCLHATSTSRSDHRTHLRHTIRGPPHPLIRLRVIFLLIIQIWNCNKNTTYIIRKRLPVKQGQTTGTPHTAIWSHRTLPLVYPVLCAAVRMCVHVRQCVCVCTCDCSRGGRRCLTPYFRHAPFDTFYSTYSIRHILFDTFHLTYSL